MWVAAAVVGVRIGNIISPDILPHVTEGSMRWEWWDGLGAMGREDETNSLES